MSWYICEVLTSIWHYYIFTCIFSCVNCISTHSKTELLFVYFWKKLFLFWSFVNVCIEKKLCILMSSLHIILAADHPSIFFHWLISIIYSWPNLYHCNRLGFQTTPQQAQAIPWLNKRITSPKMHCPLVTVVPKCLMKATNPVRAMSTMLEPLQME